MKELEEQVRSSQSLHTLAEGLPLHQLPLTELELLRSRIRADLERLESVSVCGMCVWCVCVCVSVCSMCV